MPNYIHLIGEYYTDAKVHTTGDPSVYANLVWESTPITQAELDSVHLLDYKTLKILEFAQEAQDDIIAGFSSSALGSPHWYDSEPEDQLNLIGAVATNSTMEYSCRAATRGCQEIDMGGACVGTNATGFANDTTTYNAEIKINGTSVFVSIAGQDAQTITALLTEIQADLDLGANGSTIEIKDGNLLICSSTYGSTSTVDIIDTDLFNVLTGFVAENAPVAGIDESGSVAKEYKLHTHAELITVINDGKDIKLAALQKFNVKRAQVGAAADEAAVDAITWD